MNIESNIDSFGTRRILRVGAREYHYFSLPQAEAAGAGAVSRLPRSLRILLENLLRSEDGSTVTQADIRALANWADAPPADREIAFRPARVLMQDFTGVPAVADLAAMRSAVVRAGRDPAIVNPLAPVDLVIDHSVMVDHFGTARAFDDNVALEMTRNAERYRFLRWGQTAFDDFRVVPPGTGICHQVNLEYLARVVWSATQDGVTFAYPDTLVGTDSHTTMINGLGVLGWGVGGIEAEAAMLGQPISMLIPDVIGFELRGRLAEGVTATDLVLTVTELLRRKGVVGKFVEFFGEGLADLPLADRATIANMAPEYGATCGFFPVDAETLDYLRLSNRPPETIALVEAYAKAQGLWRYRGETPPVFTDTVTLDLATVVPSVAGPKRPQDRVPLSDVGKAFDAALASADRTAGDLRVPVAAAGHDLGHGDVVIAAITSCTNTSNPAVMLAAGLVARKAVERGLSVKPWVKTSLAPGSKVVTDYLAKTGLGAALDRLGFNLVGYGCTTCIGNSGPLAPPIVDAIHAGDLVVSAVLSGNRNFEGRVHQEVRANWLASPPLVVAFAIAGTTRIDLTRDALGTGSDGRAVYLRDLWPTGADIAQAMAQVSADLFARRYADVFTGPPAWQAIEVTPSGTYAWDDSTYIKEPPFFGKVVVAQEPTVSGARILALLGDSVTTDHISPAGEIQADSPAGRYLRELGVAVGDFNSYGARRGNHEVMVRGTFANIRIRNEMLAGVEGGFTRHVPSGATLPIYDAAMRYREAGIPLVVIAGKEYGTGSSRDWAAKGTRLLGVKAVVVESFERIHRSNLVGMGVLPVQFRPGDDRRSLGLTGDEVIDVAMPAGVTSIAPKQELRLRIHRADGSVSDIPVQSRLDTEIEIACFRTGGILSYVLQRLIAAAG